MFKCVGERGGCLLPPRSKGVVSRDDDDLGRTGVISPAPRRLANGDLYFNSVERMI